VEKLRVETEKRRTQGVAGEWEVVTPTTQPVLDAPLSDPDSSTADVSGTLKREADLAVDAENARHFKLRKKTVGVGLGEIYDPGIIPIKLKKKEEEEVVSGGDTDQTPVVTPAKVAAAPKWTKVKWKRAGEEVTHEADSNGDVHEHKDEQVNVTGSPGIKPEPDTKLEVESPPNPPSPVKLENASSLPAPESGGGLFRKRKAPGGTRRQL
jgi:WW domain-binding protein 4